MYFLRVSTLTLTLTIKQHSFKKKCFRTIRSVSECESLQSDIDNLVQWSNEWTPVFNTEKCLLCSVTRKNEPITYDFNVGTKTLIRVDSQRDLGLLITCM